MITVHMAYKNSTIRVLPTVPNIDNFSCCTHNFLPNKGTQCLLISMIYFFSYYCICIHFVYFNLNGEHLTWNIFFQHLCCTHVLLHFNPNKENEKLTFNIHMFFIIYFQILCYMYHFASQYLCEQNI